MWILDKMTWQTKIDERLAWRQSAISTRQSNSGGELSPLKQSESWVGAQGNNAVRLSRLSDEQRNVYRDVLEILYHSRGTSIVFATPLNKFQLHKTCDNRLDLVFSILVSM